MSMSKTLVASACLNVVLAGSLIAMSHCLVIKPYLQWFDHKISVSDETIANLAQAEKGDEQALQNLVNLSHRDNYRPYLILDTLYRNDAIKKAGVNLESTELDLSGVNTDKNDQLLVQAMKEVSDYELFKILDNSRQVFDGFQHLIDVSDAKLVSTSAGNYVESLGLTKLSQDQRDEMLSCYKELKGKFSNKFLKFLNYRSIGTCSPGSLVIASPIGVVQTEPNDPQQTAKTVSKHVD